ncbi:hypothetical protein ABZS66_33080 [Dactylosporangium sp. NPDC005572]|uniref:hypothetical protein n=1 Tax=Dactylosporangium sp. NPDC005572 TaxID=3156889 RepID=UPI0033A4131E
MTEISGLVATANGFMAVQDSQPSGKPKIYQLDNSCKLLSTINYPTPARDPEDLAVDKNGTFWIGDLGDNDEASGGTKEPRKTVAVWSLPSGSKEPTINRLAYPDGKKRDAEALLLAADGSPIIITKSPVGEVWVPEGPLQPKTEAGVKLKKVGQFNPQDTKTANPLGLLGWKLITGAATSPDGAKVVIRTYSDAYEFDVKGGEVVKAITSGKPRITPLPMEAQGEAITYSADGKTYITASDLDSSKKAPLLRYTPTNISPDKGNGANLPTPNSDDPGFLASLTLQDITYAVAAIGIVGLGLVVAGIVGIRRARAARRLAGPAGARASVSGGGPDGDGPGGFGGPDGGPDGDGPRGGGTVYGAQPAPAGRGGGGNVYGGAPSSPAPQGTTYGGGSGGGTTYGSGGGSTYGSGGSGGGTYGSSQGGTYGSSPGGYDAQPPGPRGFGQAGGFPPPAPGGNGTRGVYGGRGQQPDDYDGRERGYAPHR